MNKIEHLLTIVAEECVEVAQRATKALRFGLKETQEGHTETNAERLRQEFADLQATLRYLSVETGLDFTPSGQMLMDKVDRIDEYLKLSEGRGTLNVA